MRDVHNFIMQKVKCKVAHWLSVYMLHLLRDCHVVLDFWLLHKMLPFLCFSMGHLTSCSLDWILDTQPFTLNQPREICHPGGGRHVLLDKEFISLMRSVRQLFFYFFFSSSQYHKCTIFILSLIPM